MQNFDVCIIGSGPAGMKAATECACCGATVLLLDEQPAPGGQIYRAVGKGDHPAGKVLGPDYLHGAVLVQELEKAQSSGNLEWVSQATVWRVDKDKRVYWSRNGCSKTIHAQHIIIATGATERSFPFPGWTLPGVMTAGAAQILLKTAQVAPRQAVLAGTGPLLYLLAVQLIDMGMPPLALVDTQQPENYRKSLRYLGGALQGYRYLLKGMKLLQKIRRAGIQHFTRATRLEASGQNQVESLTFYVGHKQHQLTTSAVLCHIGVTPDVQLTRSLEAAHQWDALQHCWKPVTDEYGQTSVDGVSVAGDNGGIGGAKVAELQGELVALAVLRSLNISVPQSQQRCDQLKRRITQELAVRPFLDALYAPPATALSPSNDTIICRCEEITAGDIRLLAREGNGINQIKTLTRCGMGPCQGRYCGATVCGLIAAETGKTPAQVGYYRIRHPVKPLKLGELASLTSASDSFMTRYRHPKENNHDTDPASAYQSANE